MDREAGVLWFMASQRVRHNWSELNLEVSYHAAAAAKSLQLCPTLCDPMNRSMPGLPVSITNSQSLPKPMSIESVRASSHLIICRPLLLRPQSFPASGSFQMSQLFASGGQSIGISVSILVHQVTLIILYHCQHDILFKKIFLPDSQIWKQTYGYQR